jgi:hypothetical protein
MASWRRHSLGLPVQWLVSDHAPDGAFYYARVDVGYAVLSFITSLLVVLSASYFWLLNKAGARKKAVPFDY